METNSSLPPADLRPGAAASAACVILDFGAAVLPGGSIMCELFGLSGRNESDITGKLKEFFSHAPENPNGWGLAYTKGKENFFHKECISAGNSSYMKQLTAGTIKAENAIGHIRFATIGNDRIENTHPFCACDESGRKWIFAHNGTIFEGDTLDSYFYVQQGETDSERIFLYFMDCINDRIRRKKDPPGIRERFGILERAVTEIAPQNKVNLLIFDGEILYAHTNFRDSLYEMYDAGNVFISTRPLSEGVWTCVPFTRLLAYKDGSRILTGTDHGYEYIPDEASINAVMMAYSGL